MNTRIISNYSEFKSVKTQWLEVYRKDPDAQLFLSWDWLDRIFSQNLSHWCVIAVQKSVDDSECVAFFPLRLRARLSKDETHFCEEVTMAGSFFWSDYTGFICDPEFDAEALPQFARALQKMHWNRVFLKHLHCRASRQELFLRAFSSRDFYIEQRTHTIDSGGIDKLICPYVRLPESFDEYLNNQHSSNSRQKIRRFLRKVDEQSEFEITITNESTLDRDLDIFTQFWYQKWNDSKGKRPAQRLAEKYQNILRSAFAANLLFMPVLWRNGEPLGALCHFIDREKKQLLFFVAGRQEHSNNPPTGLLLHAYSLRWAIEQGLNQYDFLRGNEPYKYSFGCEEKQIQFIVIGTLDGKNLNGGLSTAAVNTVMRLSRHFEDTGRQDLATIGYQQVLQVSPEYRDAVRRLDHIALSKTSPRSSTTGSAEKMQRDRRDDLISRRREAMLDETIPSIPVSDYERARGEILPDTLELGHQLFSEYGVLKIENAFDVDHIEACNRQYQTDYAAYFGKKRPRDCLPIGHQRFQITVELKDRFNQPAIYANPIVLGLMKSLLGKRHVLGCTVCATSMPGSRDQHLHKDHRALFTTDADDPPTPTPPFAITLMVPLVSLDEAIGTTLVKKKSHLLSRRDSEPLPSQLPVVPVGSCFLMDLRLSHQGLGNSTNQIRPILNMVYQQRWFADNKNFSKQAPLRISDKEFAKIPGELRYLFAWAVQPGPDVPRDKLKSP